MITNITDWLDITTDRFPGENAIYSEKGFVTFEQLRLKAYAIARKIIETNVGVHRPIVVYLEKSAETIVSFMGIACSRNFYSPIDISMPEARVNKILDILEPTLVITTKEYARNFESFKFSGSYIYYEEIEIAQDDAEVVTPVKNSIIDTDLLYVLFTSGSTGIPKGVSISHRSVLDYIDWVTDTFGINETDSFGNQAPFYFDNSILDIYCMLKTGATLYIIPHNLFSQPVLLLEFLKEHGINNIFWVPSAMIMVSRLKALKNVDLSSILRRVLFCGEVMPTKQLNIWREYLPNCKYVNLYGPTEITDACTYFIVEREFSDEESLPIGFPMKNTEIMVLDEEDNLITVPDRVGELCVCGTSLAMGYYNNAEKTRETFVQNPFNKAYEEKIYRTGDLVKYNEYHELIYISRKDFQIKHMGHRIELGEIEVAASSLEEINMCCCLYDEIRKKIILFIDSELEKEFIIQKLSLLIPQYMLPGKVVCVKDMPLNVNGKIDRIKLREWI